MITTGSIQPSLLVVAFPAAVGVLTLLLVRRSRRAAYAIAALGGLLGLLSAVWLLSQQMTGDAAPSPRTIGALPTGGSFAMPLHLQIDALTVIVATAVALVSLVIQLFTRWYLADDPRYRVFAATVGLFTAAMQLVVLSGDVLLIIVGWELMGWCSYLLIGHESDREKARRAAYKAFLVTRFADAPFFIGLIALAVGAHSTSIPAIIAHWSTPGHATALSAALICVICGVAGKSAQVPFQDWLPDAMEGPTPASALIHAATMVAAGTVVLSRIVPLLEQSDPARYVLVVVASISTVLAGVLAFLQNDLKRLLAWSTVSQVGLMLLALSILPPGATPDLAIMHLLSHAMFKALLFLAIGWLSVLVGGTVVPRMSGALRRHPSADTMMAVGLLALAGVPPLSGFVSKDLIVDEAAHRGAAGDGVARIGFVAIVVMVALTAAYCMRAWLILDHRTIAERRQAAQTIEDSHAVQEVGILEMLETSAPVDARGHEIRPVEPGPEAAVDELEVEEAEAARRPPRPGRSARWGLATLTLLSVVGGGLALAPVIDVDWSNVNGWLIAATLLLMAAVALLVRVMSLGTIFGDAAARVPQAVRNSGLRGFGADTAYVNLVGRPVLALARSVAALDDLLDRGVRDLASDAWSLSLRGLAAHNRRPTTGLLALTTGLVVVGVLGVALW
ncbi:NADH-quinone oxidoreductase subunit L [Leekyejoonella antrihumi]|uniref:NADH-quinone oxidoreductase subunit L n=1 Tax=Leekyejoonella antrihumi TaxID=1660198 RepID=A0A563E531_9MICO|nr:NADH-quinone oxidoreductase subunit L [Leekyejoonella antrihumi]TWP37332.1 NADH-quinone oxidoreductase subunit L [Leekyejoonella antrihumi]